MFVSATNIHKPTSHLCYLCISPSTTRVLLLRRPCNHARRNTTAEQWSHCNSFIHRGDSRLVRKTANIPQTFVLLHKPKYYEGSAAQKAPHHCSLPTLRSGPHLLHCHILVSTTLRSGPLLTLCLACAFHRQVRQPRDVMGTRA